MATDYAEAVRNGSMAAARLHVQLGTEPRMQQQGGSIDVFEVILRVELPLLLRPLKGLLGAYFPEPIPGVMVTTERPLSICCDAQHGVSKDMVGCDPRLEEST